MRWEKIILVVLMLATISCQERKAAEQKSNTSVLDPITDQQFISFPDSVHLKADWSKENQIIFHVLGEPDDLHPTNSGSSLGRVVHSFIHGYLMVPDMEGQRDFVPSLVKAMPIISDNELEFTYYLKDGITWDDGISITVQDVEFSLKAARCPLTNNPHYRPYAENLIAVETDTAHPRKFTLVFKERNLLNIGILTLFPIMQETYRDSKKTLRNYTFQNFENEETGADLIAWAGEFNHSKYGRNPDHIVGAGPYKFEKWLAGQSFTLKLKHDHWSSHSNQIGLFYKGYPERIIFKINSDPNSQLLEFKTQVYDGSSSLSIANYNQLLEDPRFIENYNSRVINGYNYSYLGFNCRPNGIDHPKLFTDPNIRRAIAQLIPYEHINMVLHKGNGVRTVGPISPLKQSYHHNLKLITRNPESAKKILADAGWKDTDGDNILDKIIDGERVSLEFDLNYLASPASWKDMASMISETLYEVGIKCDPSPMSFAVLRQKNRSHDFDAMLSAWAGSSSPEDHTQVWHTRSWANKGSNYVGFGNAHSDALIDSIKLTINANQRINLERTLQEVIYKEQPYVFLFSLNKRIVAHKRYKNVSVYSDRPYFLLNNWQLGVGTSDEM